MRSSVVDHPTIVVRQWQLEFCTNCDEPFLKLNNDGLCTDCDPFSEIAVGVEVECKFLEDVPFWGGLTIKKNRKLSGPVTRWQPDRNFLRVGTIPLAIPINKVRIKELSLITNKSDNLK